MDKNCLAGLLLILTSALGSDSYAQESYPIEPGTRVRLGLIPGDIIGRSAETSSILTGTVRSWSDSAVVLEIEGREQRILRDSIDKLEVSLGEKSNVGKGAWIGALGGFAIGLAAGWACSADTDCAAATEDVVVVLVSSFVFGAIGTGLGAGIGASAKSERWEEYQNQSLASLGWSATFAFSLRL